LATVIRKKHVCAIRAFTRCDGRRTCSWDTGGPDVNGKRSGIFGIPPPPRADLVKGDSKDDHSVWKEFFSAPPPCGGYSDWFRDGSGQEGDGRHCKPVSVMAARRGRGLIENGEPRITFTSTGEDLSGGERISPRWAFRSTGNHYGLFGCTNRFDVGSAMMKRNSPTRDRIHVTFFRPRSCRLNRPNVYVLFRKNTGARNMLPTRVFEYSLPMADAHATYAFVCTPREDNAKPKEPSLALVILHDQVEVARDDRHHRHGTDTLLNHVPVVT